MNTTLASPYKNVTKSTPAYSLSRKNRLPTFHKAFYVPSFPIFKRRRRTKPDPLWRPVGPLKTHNPLDGPATGERNFLPKWRLIFALIAPSRLRIFLCDHLVVVFMGCNLLFVGVLYLWVVICCLVDFLFMLVLNVDFKRVWSDKLTLCKPVSKTVFFEFENQFCSELVDLSGVLNFFDLRRSNISFTK
jgi:hypothetical protein